MKKDHPKTVSQLFAMPGTWCQYRFRDQNGACCLSRAIADVYGAIEAERARALVLAKTGMSSIVDWNDVKGRTQAEVHALAVELGI